MSLDVVFLTWHNPISDRELGADFDASVLERERVPSGDLGRDDGWEDLGAESFSATLFGADLSSASEDMIIMRFDCLHAVVGAILMNWHHLGPAFQSLV